MVHDDLKMREPKPPLINQQCVVYTNVICAAATRAGIYINALMAKSEEQLPKKSVGRLSVLSADCRYTVGFVPTVYCERFEPRSHFKSKYHLLT